MPDDPPPPRIGEVLVHMLATTPAAIDAALERQVTSGRNIGDELIEAGDVSSTSVSVAAGIQARRQGDPVGAARDTIERMFARTAELIEAARALREQEERAHADPNVG